MVFDLRVSNHLALRYGLCKAIVKNLEQIEKTIKLIFTSEAKIPVGSGGLVNMIAIRSNLFPYNEGTVIVLVIKRHINSKGNQFSVIQVLNSKFHPSPILNSKCKNLILVFRYSLSQASHFFQYNTFIGNRKSFTEQPAYSYVFSLLEKTRNVNDENLKEYSESNLRSTNDPIKLTKSKLADVYRKILKHIAKKMNGLKLLFFQEVLSNLEDYMFEDEDEYTAKWRGYFKQYLGLKAKRWKLNENKQNSNNQESLICNICEKKFIADKLSAHSKTCLEHAKELENFNTIQKQIIKLSEAAVELKQDITVKASIKR